MEIKNVGQLLLSVTIAASLLAAPRAFAAADARPEASAVSQSAKPIKKLVTTVRSRGTFNMPDGDISKRAPAGKVEREEVLTRIPMGEDELRYQKETSADGFVEQQATSDWTDSPDAGASELFDAAPSNETEAQSDARAKATTAALDLPCVTNVSTGHAPSDIHGAAGSTVLVVVTNVDIGVYNKANCLIVSRVPLATVFAGFADIGNQRLFDPRVLYDTSSGRFFVTAESRDARAGNTDQYQYFAVSTSGAASGWSTYRIQLSRGTSFFCKRAADTFWDYPSAGKSGNRWFITANDFPTDADASGAILAIDKAPTLSGAPASVSCWNNLAYNSRRRSFSTPSPPSRPSFIRVRPR